MSPICQIRVRWLTPEEGGRATPVGGGRYTPTARFAGEQEHFSVVLSFPGNKAMNPTKGTLRLLNVDLLKIQRRIQRGTALEIMEGARMVARCEVESLDDVAVVAGAQGADHENPPLR